MKERNEFVEMHGLFFESETHEWFNDKVSTEWAQLENRQGVSLPNIMCFVVRDKSTGEYDRVIMDKNDNKILYDSKSLEDIGTKLDMMKVIKHFK